MEDLQNFNLSKLIKFLHRTLILTEEVKTILKANCEEAMYCLQPWCVEVNPQQEVNKSICTCLKVRLLRYCYIFFIKFVISKLS